jgi:hypothetical protein
VYESAFILEQSSDACEGHYTTLHYTTLHYTPITTLHYTTLNYTHLFGTHAAHDLRHHYSDKTRDQDHNHLCVCVCGVCVSEINNESVVR